MVETIELTDAAVKNLKPSAKLRWIRDDGAQSLYLVIHPRRDGDKRKKRNAKSWLMRFRDPDGRPRKIVLGPFDLSGHELKETPQIGQPLSLAAARALAADVNRRRTEATEKVTLAFGGCAVEFIRDYRTRWHTRPRRWFEYARVLGLSWPRDADPGKTEPDVIKGGLAEKWADKPVTE